tara:strand:- start:115 stop:465 length:351 start_codon:yes stop_codon:yes gene_type:complete
MKQKVMMVSVTVVLSTMISVLMCWLLWFSSPPPTVVTLDLKQLIKEFVVASATTSLKDEALESHVADYTQRLEFICQKLAHQEHLVIVPKEAAIWGGQDITGQVRALLDAGYGGKE